MGVAGSIRFGPPLSVGDVDAYGRPDGGIAAAKDFGSYECFFCNGLELCNSIKRQILLLPPLPGE